MNFQDDCSFVKLADRDSPEQLENLFDNNSDRDNNIDNKKSHQYENIYINEFSDSRLLCIYKFIDSIAMLCDKFFIKDVSKLNGPQLEMYLKEIVDKFELSFNTNINRVKELDKQYNNLKFEREKLSTSHEIARLEMDRLQSELQSIRKDSMESQFSADNFRDRVVDPTGQMKEYELQMTLQCEMQKRKKVEKKMVDLVDERDNLEIERDNFEKQIKKLKKEIRELNAKQNSDSDSDSNKKELKKTIKDKEKQIKKMKTEIAELKDDNDSLELKCKSLKKNLNNTSDDFNITSKYKQDIARMTDELTEQESTIRKLQSEIDTEKETNTLHVKEIDNYKKLIEDMKSKINKLQNTEKENLEKIIDYKNEIEKHIKDKEEINTELQSLLKYNVDFKRF